MGNQSYVLLCIKITSFPPSEGRFSEKLGIFSKKRSESLPNQRFLFQADFLQVKKNLSNISGPFYFRQTANNLLLKYLG